MSTPKSPPPEMGIVRNQRQSDEEAFFQPSSLAEWTQYERMRAVLPIWVEQAHSERRQREKIADRIFILIFIEIALFGGILIAVGLKVLDLPIDLLLKWALPALFTKIVLLAFVVVKYLFNENLRHNLDELFRHSEAGQTSSKATSAGKPAKNG